MIICTLPSKEVKEKVFFFFFTFCLAPSFVSLFARGRGSSHVQRRDMLAKPIRCDQLEVFERHSKVELSQRENSDQLFN